MEETGTIYLLHYDEPIGGTLRRDQAQHYVGFYLSERRLQHHENGTSGAALPTEFFRRGIGFTVARTRAGTRDDERRIKRAGGMTRYCPLCVPVPFAGVWGPWEPSTPPLGGVTPGAASATPA